MKHFRSLEAAAVGIAVAVGVVICQPVYAQLTETNVESDVVSFGPASNPYGFTAYVIVWETNASETALFPAAVSVPNNTGITLYDDTIVPIPSDQLWVQNGFWYFASDTNLISFSAIGVTEVGSLVETGFAQDVSAYFNLPANSVVITSDVPEPASVCLLGLVGSVWFLVKRQRARRD